MEFIIDRDEWLDLKKMHTQEYLINYISEKIEGLPMPLKNHTLEQAKNSFLDLIDMDSSNLFVDDPAFGFRYPNNATKLKRFIDISRVGSISSDFFQQENRWNSDSLTSPSPKRCWEIEKFRKGFLKALFTLKYNEVNNNSLRSCIALRKYICGQFRPSAAKAIYDEFKGDNVLDFSSGWGDRLAAFYASKNCKNYVGIDPNVNLREAYTNQINFYSSFGSGKNAEILSKGAEDVFFNGQVFDLIFTSPPYFNIEKYSHDLTQSFKKFKGFENWLNNFLFTVVDKFWKNLKKGGHLIINISDVYSGHQIRQICDPLLNLMSSKKDADYIECIGLRIGKRVNTKSSKNNNVLCEPVFVWKKNA